MAQWYWTMCECGSLNPAQLADISEREGVWSASLDESCDSVSCTIPGEGGVESWVWPRDE